MFGSNKLCPLFEYSYDLNRVKELKLTETDGDEIFVRLLPADSGLGIWRLPENGA